MSTEYREPLCEATNDAALGRLSRTQSPIIMGLAGLEAARYSGPKALPLPLLAAPAVVSAFLCVDLFFLVGYKLKYCWF